MSHGTTALAAVLFLLSPIGSPFLYGLAPVVGIGSGLLSTQAAYAQAIIINPMYGMAY